MVASGFVTFCVGIMVVLFVLGKPGNGADVLINMIVIYGGSLLGFLAPAFLVPYMERRGGVLLLWARASAPWKIVVTFALMVISGSISYLVAPLAYFTLGTGMEGTLVGTIMIVGFLAPGVIVWCLHKRGMGKRRS